jgi:hypothetical protein
VIPAAPGSQLVFRGVGYAGLADPQASKGFEAKLTMFHDSAHCNDTEPGLVYADFDQTLAQGLTFENMTFNGTHGSSYGIVVQDAFLTLRDVIVAHSAGVGVSFKQQSTTSGIGVSIEHSAFIDDGDGLFTYGGDNSIDQDTFFGNTDYGAMIESQAHMYGDTFTGNAHGLYAYTFAGAQFLLEDSAVAGDQGADCDLNDEATFDADTSHDLLAANTCGDSGPGDIDYQPAGNDPSKPLGTPGHNHGPTPSILPTAQMAGAGAAPCGATNDADQREAPLPVDGPCDIGSVTPSAADHPVPTVSPSGTDYFGRIKAGQARDRTIEISNGGGNLAVVSSVVVRGSQYRLVDDSCPYAILEPESACAITVELDATTAGKALGALKVHLLHGRAPRTLKLKLRGEVSSGTGSGRP